MAKYYNVIGKTRSNQYTTFRNVTTPQTLVEYMRVHEYVFATFYLLQQQGDKKGARVGYWNRQQGLVFRS